MKSTPPAPAPSTRRDRRAAARRSATAASRPSARGGGVVAGIRAFVMRSPMLSLTGAVVVVAVVAIVGMQLLQPKAGSSGSAAPGTRTAAGILVPAIGTPENVMSGRDLGRADAPVTLTVWSDFQCPACRAFAQTSELQLITDYVESGKLRMLYRDLVIIGEESNHAAAASRCAERQDLFWPFHDVLFANQGAENSGNFTAKRLADMADAAGLDRAQYDACLKDPATLSAVATETAQGMTRGQSTPTLDFGSYVFAGGPSYAQLTAKVDELLAAAGKK